MAAFGDFTVATIATATNIENGDEDGVRITRLVNGHYSFDFSAGYADVDLDGLRRLHEQIGDELSARRLTDDERDRPATGGESGGATT